MYKADSPNTTSPSRRTVLAGLSVATASVAAVDILLAARVPGGDPIFAAIEAHQKARAALNASPYGRMKCDDPGCEEAEALDELLSDREFEALQAMFSTRPTTIAGVLALLDYIAQKQYLLKEPGAEEFLPTLTAALREIIAA
jgi:hypothetical protein